MVRHLFLFLGLMTFTGSGIFGIPGIGTAQAHIISNEWKISRNYPEVREYLAQIADHHSENARLISIGISDAGLPIEALEVGEGNVHHLVVGTHHGNEYGSTEVAKALAHSLAEVPIPGVKVTVIPVLNTSGYDRRNRYEYDSVGRRVDPNRDYPGPCGSKGPFFLKSTRALADYVISNRIVATATLHTYWPVVTYPWGFPTSDLLTGYEDVFIALAQAATQESRYPYGNTTKMVYPVAGSYEDWAFWAQGTWSLLFEMGHSHFPSQKAVEEMILKNVPGLRAMLALAPHEPAENHDFHGNCDARLLLKDPEWD